MLPGRVAAGDAGTSGLVMFSGRRDDGRPFILYEVHGGGEGGSADRDGTNAIRVTMSNVMNTPVEVIESEYPLSLECCELRPDSAGRGRHRGGLGLRRAYRLLAPAGELTTMAQRVRIPPWGVLGGAGAAPFRITLVRDEARVPVRGKENRDLVQDDQVIVETCGGGGFGLPAERPAELREADIAGGYVTDPEGRRGA